MLRSPGCENEDYHNFLRIWIGDIDKTGPRPTTILLLYFEHPVTPLLLESL